MSIGFDGAHRAEGISSLERVLDLATDRYNESLLQRSERKLVDGRRPAPSALVREGQSARALSLRPTRLRWRGIEVSDEFQVYAARVERGEQLAPYRGQVLARPCREFPWQAEVPELDEPRASAPPYAGWLVGAAAFFAAFCVLSTTREEEAASDASVAPAPAQLRAALTPSPAPGTEATAAPRADSAPSLADELGPEAPLSGPSSKVLSSRSRSIRALAAGPSSVRRPRSVRAAPAPVPATQPAVAAAPTAAAAATAPAAAAAAATSAGGSSGVDTALQSPALDTLDPFGLDELDSAVERRSTLLLEAAPF